MRAGLDDKPRCYKLKCPLCRSDAEEELLLVHPIEHQPVQQHYGDAQNERLESGAEDPEDAVSEIRMQVFDEEVFPKVSNQVGCDRVHADYDERKRPAAVAFDINDPREGGEEGEADAAAPERP